MLIIKYLSRLYHLVIDLQSQKTYPGLILEIQWLNVYFNDGTSSANTFYNNNNSNMTNGNQNVSSASYVLCVTQFFHQATWCRYHYFTTLRTCFSGKSQAIPALEEVARFVHFWKYFVMLLPSLNHKPKIIQRQLFHTMSLFKTLCSYINKTFQLSTVFKVLLLHCI